MVPQQAPGAPNSQNTDEYELVPRSQLEYLQREVEKLKRNPFGDSASAKDMFSAVESLNRNMAKLVAIFETANDEIVRDYKDKANTEKINQVLEQNEKLAKGIVVIADLLKELKSLRAEPWPSQQAPANPSSDQVSFPAASQEWSPTGPAPQQAANPFLEQQFGQMQPPPAALSQGVAQAYAQQQFGQPAQQFGVPAGAPQQRRLPPIDFSAVPPPPRR